MSFILIFDDPETLPGKEIGISAMLYFLIKTYLPKMSRSHFLQLKYFKFYF